MKQTRPVLIVGAGPTGLTAAMELARFNVPVRLVDQYTTAPHTSRAIAVQSRTLELMHQRGLAGSMTALGNKGYAAALYEGERRLGKVGLHQLDSRFNFILLLSQAETERILREQVERAGVALELATQLLSCAPLDGASGGVLATLRKSNGQTEQVEAAYLIDAEGAHSMVRHAMALAFDGSALPNTYVVADLYLEGDVPQDELSIYLPASGLLAAFPMGQRRFRLIATEKHAVDQDAPAPGLDYFQAAWQHGVATPVRFHDLIWSSRFRINSRALKQLRHGSIFFAGDAAHIHSPAGGQGMNTGIQDAINLGWKLAMVYHGLACDALLDTYADERLPIIEQLLTTTERATDIANSNSQLVHVMLRHLLPLALSVKAVRRLGAGVVSELGTNYRQSTLNADIQGGGALHAGDRFPDVAVTDTGPARMIDMLDPGRLTIIALGEAASAASWQPAALRALCVQRPVTAPSAALVAALGTASVAVVRPDGYLLCAGSAAAVQDQLERWCAQWLTLET